MRLEDIKGHLKYRLKRLLGRNQPFMPEEIRSDDVFVVSYPKSGNTWVRFLLANALYPDAEVDFHTIHELIPEVGQEELRRDALPSHRLLKSHAPYRAVYPRVIYILRDGRDVYTSYYHYKQLDLDTETTFEDFLSGRHWPTRWAEHVRGWMRAAAVRDNILVVRFEDLKEDSVRELRRMVSFLDRGAIPESQLQDAAEAYIYQNMRRLEKERGRKYEKVERFMRKGKAGNWEEMFTKSARKIFKNEDGGALVENGYVENKSW